MTIEHIKEKLSSIYDEFTVDILSNTILDFQKLFNEKYLKTDEVIELVTNNIPKGIILYDDVGNKFDAICSLSDKEFKVNKDVLKDNDYFTYVFFHEFIHSISYKKCNNVQYMGFYTREKGEEYQYKSKSFNEAVTEFITLKRNCLYNYVKEDGALSGYDVGTVELELLCKIIDEDVLIDAYFNKQDQLENIFKQYNMQLDEIFGVFHLLESEEANVYRLSNNYGITDVNAVYDIINASRLIFYNLIDAFGEIKNEKEFNNKWSILFSEKELKYNFYDIDEIFRYRFLVADIERLKIDNNNEIIKNIPVEKYILLNKIFENDDKFVVLSKLYDVYKDDYKKYFDLFKNNAATLVVEFLDSIKNNYQLYDIEIYPRVYPYLKLEKTTIDKVDFKKVKCEEAKISIYIFTINNNNYVETNYEDTTVNKINNTLFEIKYGDQVEIFNLEKNTYKINDTEYDCTIIY